MEAEMAIPLPEGAPPRSAVEVIAKVLTKECPKSTFLKNIGLQSGSGTKPTAAHVSSQVLDLEDKLRRSQDESAEMKAELAAMKKKSEEELDAIKKKADAAEAAQAERDRDYQALLKRTEESDARIAQMMALFGARSAGN
jgi:hypothetical protein